MAVNQSRSMNVELLNGGTDGKYRKNRPNTSANLASNDAATLGDKSTLHPGYGYAIALEAPIKMIAGRRV